MSGCGRRGFALVAVLWILVAVGAASVAFHASARTQRRGVVNAADEIRARWAARGALARVLDAVERDGVGRGDWPAPGLGGTRGVVEGRRGPRDVEVFVEILDARAKLNLNRATPSELTDFLGTALGGAGPEALGLRDVILDWRDRDDRRRPGGAEASEYALLDRPGRASNGPFESMGELRELKGFHEGHFGVLAPLVTVVGDGLINVNAAHPVVLTALPGVDAEIAALLARARVERAFTSVFDMIRALPPMTGLRLEARVEALQARVAFGPREMEIRIRARPPGSGVTASVDATVRLLGGGVSELIRFVEY